MQLRGEPSTKGIALPRAKLFFSKRQAILHAFLITTNRG
jgi:hypothetical protein